MLRSPMEGLMLSIQLLKEKVFAALMKKTFRGLSIPSPRWKSYVLINRHFRPHKKTYLMDLYLVGYLHLLCVWLSSSRVLGGYPIWWSLALGQQYSSLGSQPILCGSIPGLVPKQLRFCRNYIEIMPSVAEGVKLGIQECQHQFRGRRWNCTTIKDNLAIFGPVLDKATRESAFVHAIASAGVAFAVTRSCAEGTSTMCGCDSHHKGPPGEGWKWGGCSEDAEFGVLVSREFADARENRPDARSAMNRHNNEAGRMTILENMHLRCKCHGLSGSCEVKTCWWAQPDFRLLGDYLKDKYDSASEMVVEKHRESRGWVETLRAKYTFFKHPTERDLVYYEGSPNFCEPNPETGSFGTRDRSCNVSSHGIEGCDLLCCGRGHNTRTEKRKEKCHCIFHWCCYVSCQECVRVYDVHTCK
ncbi:hypothetical protein KOW79_011129 [Hemibagrus wyckioides]|uniref:Protein Wnt n=2 Tax=Hemibagrus wyckioides TaxID=337641 RepID=A0A9D3SMH4_9TELE|nr:hypothetical protein KOW79_011129 [Hemibagrus wyckioides]